MPPSFLLFFTPPPSFPSTNSLPQIEAWVERNIGGALERLLSPRDKNKNEGLRGAFAGMNGTPGAPDTGLVFLPGVVLQGPDTAAMRQRQKMNRRRTRTRTFMEGLEPKKWLPGRGLVRNG